MASLLILAVCLLIGVGLQRVKNLPPNAHSTIGSLILYVPMPAVCLLSLPDLKWNLSLIPLALATWVVFLIPFFLVPYIGKKRGWEKELVGCLILTCGFCNTSFVGFPILEALYGKDILKHAVFLDQAGSFLIVSSLGVWVAIKYSSGSIKKRYLARKILLFPPFIAFLIGISASLFGLRFEGVSREVLERLAHLLTPLALICVGLQLKWSEIHHELKFLSGGLFYKLIMAPLIIFSLYFFLNLESDLFRVSVMETAMAPMITSSILAASHNLRPRLAGMMVGVGVPLSFLTLAFWHFLLNQT